MISKIEWFSLEAVDDLRLRLLRLLGVIIKGTHERVCVDQDDNISCYCAESTQFRLVSRTPIVVHTNLVPKHVHASEEAVKPSRFHLSI